MISRKYGVWAISAAVLALGVYVMATVAQQTGNNPRTPAASGPISGQQTTLTGRIVDLHCYMTGQFPSADRAKCTADCITRGVPAALESDTGLVLLGQGMNSPSKTILPFAYQQVEATGKMFTRGNVKYLDITSVRPFPGHPEDEESDYDHEGADED